MRGIDKSIVQRWIVNHDLDRTTITIHRWQLRTGNIKHMYALTPASLKRAQSVNVARVMGVR